MHLELLSKQCNDMTASDGKLAPPTNWTFRKSMLSWDHARAVFASAFTLSGFAALAYQVVWQRVLTQVIGSDAISVVLVVTIFMIWLGIGAVLAMRLIARPDSRAAAAYAVIELTVGIYGLFSIPFLRVVNEWFALLRIDSVVADFILNLVVLAPPVIGMGMTTPLIVHIAKRQIADLGRTVGIFYGLNILGGAIGALATGLVLIEAAGLVGTTWIAAILNSLSAAAAWMVTRGRAKDDLASNTAASPKGFGPAGIAAILFGFGTLAIQILFFRVLSNYLTLSTIVFPIVLCAYLLLMAVGQRVGGRLADRFSTRLASVIAMLFATGSTTFALALLFPPALAAPLTALRFTSFNGSLLDPSLQHLIGDPPVGVALAFSLLFMLAVVPWTALFPVLLRLVTERIEQAGDRFARLYSLYTVGNVAGAFLGGIVLLPLLGTGGTAVATSLVVGAGCLSLFSSRLYRPKAIGSTLAIIAAGCTAAMFPSHDYYKHFQLGAYKVTDVFEGRTGVATVVPTSRFYTIVDMNRTASASALTRDPGHNDQYEAWRWNHTELFALDPSFRPRQVLVIGIGHAYLIDALLDLDFIEKIVVVDLSEEIVSAVKAHTTTSTRRIFSDPRVEIVIADGRRYVQSALKRGTTFDLIQTKINEPWHAGSGNLFTVEFFELQKRLLNAGGYLGMRPLNGHLSDGLRVFKSALWPGYYHLYFKNGDLEPPSVARVTPDIRVAWSRDLPGRDGRYGPDRRELGYAFFTAVPAALATDPNTDNRPTFEYYWLRQTLGRWRSPRVSLSATDPNIAFRTVPVVTADR